MINEKRPIYIRESEEWCSASLKDLYDFEKYANEGMLWTGLYNYEDVITEFCEKFNLSLDKHTDVIERNRDRKYFAFELFTILTEDGRRAFMVNYC